MIENNNEGTTSYIKPHTTMTMTLDEIILKLKQAFEDDNVKRVVLEPEWYKKNVESGIHSIGFCYAASEVIYRLNGGKDKWKKVAISKNNWELGGHCYLENKETGEKLDITDDQYTLKNIEIPFDKGRAGGFRTKDFGNKARLLANLAGLI